MDQELIDRLIILEKSKSFSEAADKLFISRPALNQQISKLEETIGFLIFERDYKGIELTTAGKKYIEGLKKISVYYENLITECKETASSQPNHIIIGTLSNFRSIYFPKIIKEFRKNYPDIRIIFKDFPINEFFSNFESGKMDLSVEFMSAYYHDQYKNIHFLDMSYSNYYCAVSTQSSLVQKNQISFSDLRGKNLVMYRRGISVCDDLLRNYIDKNEPQITIVDIDNYSSSLFDFSQDEEAVILVYANHKDLSDIKIIETNWDFQIKFSIGYRKNCSQAVKNFLTIAKEFSDFNSEV